MTSNDNEQPSRQQLSAFYAGATNDLAAARRMLAMLHAQDQAGVHALIKEIVDSGRGSQVLFALALQCLEWAAQIVPDHDRLQQQLDELAMPETEAVDELGKIFGSS